MGVPGKRSSYRESLGKNPAGKDAEEYSKRTPRQFSLWAHKYRVEVRCAKRPFKLTRNFNFY